MQCLLKHQMLRFWTAWTYYLSSLHPSRIDNTLSSTSCFKYVTIWDQNWNIFIHLRRSCTFQLIVAITTRRVCLENQWRMDFDKSFVCVCRYHPSATICSLAARTVFAYVFIMRRSTCLSVRRVNKGQRSIKIIRLLAHFCHVNFFHNAARLIMWSSAFIS